MAKNCKNIREILQKRILVLDGAMGTMLQAQGLTDSDFNRGIFANHPVPLKGDNDVLCITRPDAVKAVHKAYLDAGADIIETNTFNSNAVSQADYGLQDHVYELAYAGAKIAREAADAAEAEFNQRFRQGAVPSDIEEKRVALPAEGIGIAAMLKAAGLVPSNGEANRNIEQGGVRINGERVSDRALRFTDPATLVVQVGKRRWAKIVLEKAGA